MRRITVSSDKWDDRYMDMAKLVATWSKDPSSKIGAVAVNEKGQILTTGYNGFPRGIADDDRLNDRPVKYKYIVHAEQNAIYNATYNGVSLHGSTMYVAGLPCCSDCAKGIIQVGVRRVVMNGDPTNERWEESTKLTLDMFKESGVEWEFIQ
jgi:dCMP deaminase